MRGWRSERCDWTKIRTAIAIGMSHGPGFRWDRVHPDAGALRRRGLPRDTAIRSLGRP